MDENLIEELLSFIDAEHLIAHIRKGGETESLREHTERTVSYYMELMEKKHLVESIQIMKEVFLQDCSDSCTDFFWKMFYAIPIMHDFGKTNPLFQEKISGKKQKAITCLDGSKHSLLSSAYFINYFLVELEKSEVKRNKTEYKKLYFIMLVNSYISSRHHGDLTALKEYLELFEDSGKLNIIFHGMLDGAFQNIYNGEIFQNPDTYARRNYRCYKEFYVMSGDKDNESKSKVYLYIYARLVYSLLVSSDYYATSEFVNHIRVSEFGEFCDINSLKSIYENTELLQTIRKFNKETEMDNHRDINYLRKMMFYEAESNLLKSRDSNIYFIEAPTGGGKSNIAMNCSFQLLNEKINKIFYVYPFNTLVEQNLDTVMKIFGHSNIKEQIAVINSNTPIKYDEKLAKKSKSEESYDEVFQKACLDRQFLNYPFVLTTHVSLFQMIFGSEKENVMNFYQLAGSVVVLDEIQSYKNTIWTEIMLMLQAVSSVLHMKIIIMSATLPQLSVLTNHREGVTNLITNCNTYFQDDRFIKRVHVSYELLDKNIELTVLLSHVIKHAEDNKKILVEFIKKSSAIEFYKQLLEAAVPDYTIDLMTGDDNSIEREQILSRIKSPKKKGMILVATQVIEAGVDIDMDIGYKDISKLDSDEQFLGRINRNFKREGITFFFDFDDASHIYHNDYRINKKYMLNNLEMREILKNKDFNKYYHQILINLKQMWNQSSGENGIETFLDHETGALDFTKVSHRMKLIDDDQWNISVFFSRIIPDNNGNELDGDTIWECYKELLCNDKLDYSVKKIRLSEVRSKMNYFIYKISKQTDIVYNDRIGELYKIDDADQYFVNGKLDRDRFSNEGSLFVDIL